GRGVQAAPAPPAARSLRVSRRETSFMATHSKGGPTIGSFGSSLSRQRKSPRGPRRAPRRRRSAPLTAASKDRPSSAPPLRPGQSRDPVAGSARRWARARRRLRGIRLRRLHTRGRGDRGSPPCPRGTPSRSAGPSRRPRPPPPGAPGASLVDDGAGAAAASRLLSSYLLRGGLPLRPVHGRARPRTLRGAATVGRVERLFWVGPAAGTPAGRHAEAPTPCRPSFARRAKMLFSAGPCGRGVGGPSSAPTGRESRIDVRPPFPPREIETPLETPAGDQDM